MHNKLWSDFAVETMGAPQGWVWFTADASRGECPDGFVKISGGVPTQHRLDGSPIYSSCRQDTIRTLFIDREKAEQWSKGWEARTGLCAECLGEGRQLASWNIEKGTTYHKCSACDGTGGPNGKPLPLFEPIIKRKKENRRG